MAEQTIKGVEKPEAVTTAPAGVHLRPQDYQSNGSEARAMSGYKALPPGMPSDECLMQHMIGIGGTSARTPAVEAAMTNITREADKLFPNQPDTGDIVHDFAMPVSAAYRYMMNKEGVDDYSNFQAADVAQLEAVRPGTVKQLDAFVADQIKQGLVPENTPKDCPS